MRFRALTLLAALALGTAFAACGSVGGGLGLFRQYEYEEDMYLSLDGTATLYVNSSIAALNALRGTSFNADSRASIDRAAVTRYFETPVTHVTRVTTSRRSNRQFVHVRLDVRDISRLSEAAPFSWSVYRFKEGGGLFLYEQTIGAAAARDGASSASAGWDGREIIAFRLHVPSKIAYHNTRREIGRGNILVWEQPLAARLKGEPLTLDGRDGRPDLDARMETQSILYRTLWLFGSTAVAVALTFALVIWWVLRRGAGSVAAAEPR